MYVFQGALEHANASNAIVYGIYPATAPFTVWAVIGVGACGIVLACAASLARLRTA